MSGAVRRLAAEGVIEKLMETRTKLGGLRVLVASLASAALLGGCSAEAGFGEEVDSVSLAACLGVKLAAPTPAAPQDAGTVVSLQAVDATCGGGETAEYRFAYQREGTSPVVEIQAWGNSDSANWNTAGLPSGKYLLVAYARAVGATQFQSVGYASYLINDVCTSTTLQTSPAPPQPSGTSVTLSASATCTGSGTPEFRFQYRLPSGGAYVDIQSYGSSPAIWNTTGLPAGKYSLVVLVRAAGNTSSWEAYRYGSYELGDGGCSVVSLAANPASPQSPGPAVTLTGTANCASGTPEYRFFYDLEGGGTNWVLIQDWNGDTANWNTSGLPLGTHTLRVDARAVGALAAESNGFLSYTLGVESWSSIAVGMGFHTCGVVSDGTARCWGENSSGQVGDGTTVNRTSPRIVSGLTGASTLAAGGFHSCALRTNGTVACWGDNTEGQFGTGSTASSNTPVTVPGISDATTVSTGTYHTCVIRSGGTVWCWGDNAFGQVGNGSFSGDVLTPTQVAGISGASRISAGGWHTCAVAGGSVYCWGLNDYGQIGTGSANDREPSPLAVNLTNVVSVSAGDSHTCVTRAPGDARCWGLNDYGQLGNGSTTNSGLPVQVSGLDGATSISAGFVHSCARRSNGSAWCWGNNDYGQLGDGTFTSRSTAAAVPGMSTASAGVAAGGLYSCARLSSGLAQCWGYNAYGQLGNGSTADASTPTLVLAP